MGAPPARTLGFMAAALMAVALPASDPGTMLRVVTTGGKGTLRARSLERIARFPGAVLARPVPTAQAARSTVALVAALMVVARDRPAEGLAEVIPLAEAVADPSAEAVAIPPVAATAGNAVLRRHRQGSAVARDSTDRDDHSLRAERRRNRHLIIDL